ncbi:MAG TPA: FecR family protein, partial [Methylomirabilota bacterium]|nr:FecR family protein [Methylomirabilota bacterium]
MRWLLLLFACFHLAAPFARSQPALERSDAATQPSRVIEAAGVVEFQAGGRPPWLAATNGLALRPGDRLRTRAGSRAGVQFSDRSVLRLSEDTILEIQPPRRTEKRRFRLPVGSIFFLHREQPADLEFETPVASGAIRGTEFILEADAVSATTRLALLEGQVELSAADQTVTLQGGEQARIEPGRPPVKSPLLEIASLVQWTLYYPAVVNPEDLPFDAGDRSALNPVLIAYQSGDLLAAHAAMTAVPSGGENRELWRAALDLAVGRAELAEARLALSDP